MKRVQVKQRENWKENFEGIGFSFHSVDGEYWKEGICYEFNSAQIDIIDDVTLELHNMCLQVCGKVVKENLFWKLGIPKNVTKLITDSWERQDISLYGRMDFSWDGIGEPKFLEYNADTPTSLYEASVAQWTWLEEVFPECDQFNSIHEKLLSKFHSLPGVQGEPFYFACASESEEDLVTVQYLQDISIQSGFDGRHIFVEDIGVNDNGIFVDLNENKIENIFKLYPWEWLLSEGFGNNLLSEPFKMVLEPAWKIILTSKGILPLLWEIFPDHPNLLEASFKPMNGKYVKKPLFSREGANISIYDGKNLVEQTNGNFGSEGFIYQGYHELPRFDGQYTLIGSWIIGNETAGIGIREDDSVITKNSSKFVPHFFR